MGILALLGQMETATVEGGNHTLVSLFLNANIVVQITIIILLVFSVVSWGIIGSKHRQLKKAKEKSGKFYQYFWQSKSIEQFTAGAKFAKNPAYNIFKTGLMAVRENQDPQNYDIVEKEIRRAADDEVESMEYGVPFLATTGSAAPFIGLFGTVWGILHAFWKIGRTGTSSLAVVGPHIAEALIATAIGLAAAIPAVIFYNVYTNKIRLISKNLDNFSDDLIDRLQKEYYQTS
jgi:biopolymer transport protein TolQ